MYFILAPFGSRGDVEPVVALGVRLISLGHRVRVCAPDNFSALVRGAGLEFSGTGSDFRDIVEAGGGNEGLFRRSLETVEQQYDALRALAPGADLILGVALQFAARTVAEELGIAYRYAVFSPVYLRSRRMPSLQPGSGLAHPEEWRREDQQHLSWAGWLVDKRASLGLAPFSSLHGHILGGEPVLGAFDPVLSPPPPDGITCQVTGYWRVTDPHMALSSDVQAFLAKGGPAPVYLGFGSMRGEGAAARLEELASAMAKAGHRVIVGAGWSGAAARLPEGCITLDDAPHDLLFPHLSAAIHHGGAGTTHAAASAGVPQIILPHLGDQFYHGTRIAELGLGPAPISLEDLTVEQLLRVVEVVVYDPTYMDRAAAFGGRMRAREGSARAAALLSGL